MNCVLPRSSHAASKTVVVAGIKSSTPPHHIFFSKLGCFCANLVFVSGTNLEFTVTSSPDSSDEESRSIEESNSHSGGSQTSSQNCQDDVIVGGYYEIKQKSHNKFMIFRIERKINRNEISLCCF